MKKIYFENSENFLTRRIRRSFIEAQNIKPIYLDCENIYSLENYLKNKVGIGKLKNSCFCEVEEEEVDTFSERLRFLEKEKIKFTNEIDIRIHNDEILNVSFGEIIGKILKNINKIYYDLKNENLEDTQKNIIILKDEIEILLKDENLTNQNDKNILEVFKFILAEYDCICFSKDFSTIRSEFIKFLLKENITLDPSFYLVTPLRLEIFYYTQTIKHFKKLIENLGYKENNKDFFESFLDGKNANVVGNGYLRGHRNINFSLIAKFNKKYKKEISLEDQSLFYKYLVHSQKILDIISNDYSLSNIEVLEKILYKQIEIENIEEKVEENIHSRDSKKYHTRVYSPFLDKIEVTVTDELELKVKEYYLIRLNNEITKERKAKSRRAKKFEKWAEEDREYISEMEDNITLRSGAEEISNLKSKKFIFQVLEIIKKEDVEYICGAIYEKVFDRKKLHDINLKKILYSIVYLKREDFRVFGKVESISFK